MVITGCTLAKVKVEVMSERTALENQVLGTYNSLDREMLLVTSVRGVDAKGQIQRPPEHSQDLLDAITAMQILAFHEDDLYAFKLLGWVGEDNRGRLQAFSLQHERVPEDFREFSERYSRDEFDSVVSQINRSREVIMRRVIDTNENLTEADLSKVQKIFGKINAENALPGEKIQGEDGKWITKEGLKE